MQTKTIEIKLKVTFLSGNCKNVSFEVEARTFKEAFRKAENMLRDKKIKKVKHQHARIVGYIFEPERSEKIGRSKIH
ncbi:hypothetical protein A0I81_10195 [Listeria monocytogenes]|uniref:hypothetical protein n=1 Tax=Listeria monocytogenes TaxID=1639 RepID=UPI000BDE9C2D|nr:hypothetical protein [Listeria monocytogenes]EAE2750779.1 hypothetical protein [Listeria monocytogenes]EAE4263391.1 hypothetical protein [Listeria monocytogenes]EAE4811139.1 hypothetical protein [Listeria monocytogenes]EAE5205016.1 hypothetical protein [Listeria monocytogenes]EAE5559691.1 hypothetical protein [Listeria monocytogenes]